MTNFELFTAEDISVLYFEEQAKKKGFRFIAGIDEAGRGPLAGPVVAAAVVLPEIFELPGLTDSKKLSERQRETLFPEIRRQAVGVGIGLASAQEIDCYNILQATLMAMGRAVTKLPEVPDHLLVDGITPLPGDWSQQTLKKGDSRSLSIAAASVIAKVVRDRIMLSFDRQLPEYGFARHKGYGTRLHSQALADHGPCSLHRKTFGGVREYVEDSF